MRVLVCGSRSWNNYDMILNALKDLKEVGAVEVVHGGAIGADALAGNAARTLRLVEHIYPADWSTHGKAAGFVRNVRMLEEMMPELVIAFWDGFSQGTQHTLGEAVSRKIRVRVFQADGSVKHTWPL